MINQNIEDGIERYIRHIRKMSLLTDDQIKTMILHVHIQDPGSVGAIGNDIDGYIENIRRTASYNDDQIRSNLRNAAGKDPALQDVFEGATQKRNMVDIQKIAMDIKSDPRKFARKVDREY